MNRYRVYGHTTVTVVVEVNAESEEDVFNKVFEELDSLTAYCGNGGTDKLIGVDRDDCSIFVDDQIEYNDIELLGLFDENEELDEEDEQ